MAKLEVLSCIANHPYFQSDFMRYDVYLNGARVCNVLVADCRKGEVTIENTIVVAIPGHPLPTRILRGKVEIVDRLN